MSFIDAAQPKLFIVNVGVNLAHRLRSPIFDDLSFEFVPIPLKYRLSDIKSTQVTSLAVPTYKTLRSYNSNISILEYFSIELQNAYQDVICHNDPYFPQPNSSLSTLHTYGDLPDLNVRAVNLKSARSGDLLLFIANLCNFDPIKWKFTNRRHMYFIGLLKISSILRYQAKQHHLISNDEQICNLQLYSSNAHVSHLLSLPEYFESEPFTIFVGSQKSIRFKKAVRISEQMCRECFLDTRGHPLDIRKFRSVDACIGSYTRTVRAHFHLDDSKDEARLNNLLSFLHRDNALDAELIR